jgi:hypothetical protein
MSSPRFNYKEDGSREKAREWRLSQAALDKAAEVKKKFNEAGIELHAFNYSFREDFNDAEIERGLRDGEDHGREEDYRFFQRLHRQAR